MNPLSPQKSFLKTNLLSTFLFSDEMTHVTEDKRNSLSCQLDVMPYGSVHMVFVYYWELHNLNKGLTTSVSSTHEGN